MFHFYAMLSRMKYINRWGLMRNTTPENISEHSLDTAFFAHALATLHNVRFGGCVDPYQAAALAMFHDVTEIITGDLPTPVKYHNPQIRSAYQQVENMAKERMLSLLPEDLRPAYAPLIAPDASVDPKLLQFVKAADKLSALVKCVEERAMGNQEFSKAETGIRQSLSALGLPEVDCFLAEFLPSFSLTLDEQDV